jgi:hypothetical protein
VEKQLLDLMVNPRPGCTQIGDVYVYNGRPDWNAMFNDVRERNPNKDVGVLFCGNPRIGDDL